MATYDKEFFNHTAALSDTSAQYVTKLLSGKSAIKSVLDVGCGEGVWLNAWTNTGITDFMGVDGDYVNRSRLRIPEERFVPRDLHQPFDLGRTFDLVQCLEVAEHIDGRSADDLVASLTRHGDMVLFSAAPPGQGGRGHVNEQPYDYWRQKFARHGFVAADGVRPLLTHADGVAYWYKYNMFLYLKDGKEHPVSSELSSPVAAADAPLPDVAPPLFRLRKAILRLTPYGFQQFLAHWVAKLH